MSENKNQVVVKPLEKFEINLTKMLEKGIKALPSDVNSDRLKLNAMMYIAQDEKLKDLAQRQPAKIAQIVYNFIALGLDMNNKECYIIPFGTVPTVILDYKGLEKLAKKYSVEPINLIYSRAVHEKDDYGFKDNGEFYHKFDPFASEEKRGKRIGSYCKVEYKSGSVDIEFVNLDEINRVKAVSKTASQKGSVWEKWEESMFRKTAVRKMTKHIPLDFGKYQEVEKAFKESDNDIDFERKNTDVVLEQNDVFEAEFEEFEVDENGEVV